MAIPQKIQKLTELALKDKVLTQVERQTIVNAALEMGVPQQEIDAYLNHATDERIRSIYSKEEMTHCPFCGALTPLISDQCLHCFRDLREVIKTATPPPYISGAEADIINRENEITAYQQHNSKTCPNCRAPFPLISNVCGYCGHILQEQTDSDLNVKKLISNIEQSIKRLKDAFNVSAKDVLMFRLPVLLFFLGALFLVLSISFGALLLCLLSFPCMIIAFFILFNMGKTASPVMKADNAYYDALYAQEMYSRTLETLYGDNPEARKTLQDFEAEIEVINLKRKKNRNMITYMFIGLIVIAFILPYTHKSAVTKYQENEEQYKQTYEISMAARKNIAPFQTLQVHDRYSNYIKNDNDAVLSIAVQYEEDLIDDHLLNGKPWYRLQVSGVKLESTGQQLPNADTAILNVFLWDKDKKPVGRKFYPIKIMAIEKSQDNAEDIDNGMYDASEWEQEDNFYSILKKGKGNCYADFIAKDSTFDIRELQSVIDSVSTFTIY
ncbi:MAG: zinc ribbon domain-containing protein [Bacteroidales bacterium]|nr:zinc ribbon domain-containing protein [Bacteroidales bacterium]